MAICLHPVPFERLAPPPELDGRNGCCRTREPCLIEADDDLSAVRCWIAAAESDSGAEARRLVSERLLNWAYLERGRALSSFLRDDFAAFLKFITAPVPLERWIGPRRARRDGTAWRPFCAPISVSGRRFAASMVRSLVDYLIVNRYADLQIEGGRGSWKDGFADTSVSAIRGLPKEPEVIELDEWIWIRRALGDSEALDVVDRLIIELTFYLAMRFEELAALTHDDVFAPTPEVPIWAVRVGGRRPWRNKGFVEAPPPLADTLQRWREGLGQLGTSSSDTSIIGLPSDKLRRNVQQVFRAAAELAEAAAHQDVAKRLRLRTPRHLRHAFERHRVWVKWPNLIRAFESEEEPQERIRQRDLNPWQPYEHMWAPLD